ncbi:DNA (cytosine-5-)-methyltransferase [Nonomuraea sp. B5E05]|uniref:DNA cytosine methyltransferase n=1 Tax=Nonomuraea sp. B5E05 TaxID=3153569 RepID=UPI0032615904
MALEAVEICAGAGGQALGLHQAGFTHRLAFELDPNACTTLRENAREGNITISDPGKVKDGTWVVEGDVADPELWKPDEFHGIDLLAGGVPCPPFTIAGKQLGATDERDLFAWAIEQVNTVQPRALLLENVRGLSMPRFAGYRQHVLDRLQDFGYLAEWTLLNASSYGVPQLRPRFVLVAMRPEDFKYFSWPAKSEVAAPTVGEALKDLMASRGWEGAEEWARKANQVAPTIVGGSKKHGGADLGPTRAKRAWEALGVDAYGVHDIAPPYDTPPYDRRPMTKYGPKLTCEMVARLQGWDDGTWIFTGGKTSQYRQIGNAFPPPVARALGRSIAAALNHTGDKRELYEDRTHDPIYRVLRDANDFITAEEIMARAEIELSDPEIDRRISLLGRDFEIEKRATSKGLLTYRLERFKAFVGQVDHARNEYLRASASKVS